MGADEAERLRNLHRRHDARQPRWSEGHGRAKAGSELRVTTGASEMRQASNDEPRAAARRWAVTRRIASGGAKKSRPGP